MSVPIPASGVDRLGTESAFAVLARARSLERAGREIVHLEIGEPQWDTPEHVAEAGIAAIRAGETHYCPAAGLLEFREAIAAELGGRRGVEVDPGLVLVGNGAKPFLFFTILAACEAGDEVIYPDPGFPIYESAIRWAGATPVPLRLREESGFSFSLPDLEEALSERTKLVILNSPNNPTGGITPREDLERAAELITRTGAWVLSDEVYSRIHYGDVPGAGEASDSGDQVASIAQVDGMLERTILLDGLSKTYAMTGWRCGYAAVPEELVDPLERFFINSTSCVPPFVQRAGIAALTGPQDPVHAMVAELRARRDLVVEYLNELPGITCRAPQGAFYAFPNVEEVPFTAEELADCLLDQAGVALLAGSAFGAAGAEHLRISYGTSRDRLERGLELMAEYLAEL